MHFMENEGEEEARAGADLHGADVDARRQAASLMGSVRSERKAAAARRNAQKTYKPMKALADIVCGCAPPDGLGLPPFKHKSTCLRGRAIKYRQGKGLPLT